MLYACMKDFWFFVLASIMDHDYSISPILENSIPLESKHRSSSMSPEHKCCYERDNSFKFYHSASPVTVADLPEVLIFKKKMENENKKNLDIIKNLRLQLQKQNEEIAYLRKKLSESDKLMSLWDCFEYKKIFLEFCYISSL